MGSTASYWALHRVHVRYNDYNWQGCLTAVEEYTKENIGIVGGIGFGVAAFQVCRFFPWKCIALNRVHTCMPQCAMWISHWTRLEIEHNDFLFCFFLPKKNKFFDQKKQIFCPKKIDFLTKKKTIFLTRKKQIFLTKKTNFFEKKKTNFFVHPQVLGVVLAACLAKKIRKDGEI